MAVQQSEVVLTQFTVYERPADYPQGYVVREWHIVRGELDPRPGEAWTAPTLDAARLIVPAGSVNLGRQPDDEPQIVETWT